MTTIEWVIQSNNIYTFWLAYILLCLPFVYILMWILPSRFHANPYFNFVFFYCISASIFVFGIIVALVIVIFFFFTILTKKERTIQTADYPDYQHAPIAKKSDSYGEGFGYKGATTNKLPKAIRQKMLIAINQFPTSNINKINSLVLSDDVDDMRLYAKSLIEKQERELSQWIKYFTQKLNQIDDPYLTAYYEKQVALVLWEQVYRYLVYNENLVAVLIKIEKLAKKAIKILVEDTELPLLLARIALRNHKLNKAKKWLDVAKKNKAPNYKIYSYLAEIDYLERNFSKIKKAFTNTNNKGLIGLEPIVSFWVTHD